MSRMGVVTASAPLTLVPAVKAELLEWHAPPSGRSPTGKNRSSTSAKLAQDVGIDPGAVSQRGLSSERTALQRCRVPHQTRRRMSQAA